MKRSILISVTLFLVCLCFAPDPRAAPNTAPFLYYYSSRVNAFVIERAVGTDMRLLGQEAMKVAEGMEAIDLTGLGWSPSGKWFAWRFEKFLSYYGNSYSVGRVIGADDTPALSFLDEKRVDNMLWAPATDRLFIQYTENAPGSTFDPAFDPHNGIDPHINQFKDHSTFAIFDVETEEVLMSVSLPRAYDVVRDLRMKWINDQTATVAIRFVERSPDVEYHILDLREQRVRAFATTRLNVLRPRTIQDISPTGDIFDTRDNVLSVVNLISEEEWAIEDVPEAISSFRWSPNGNYALLQGGSQYLWDGIKRKVTKLEYPVSDAPGISSDSVTDKIWSPDARYGLLTKPGTNQLYILDSTTGHLTPHLIPGQRYLNSIEDVTYIFDLRWLDEKHFQHFSVRDKQYLMLTCAAATDACSEVELKQTEGYWLWLSGESNNRNFFAHIVDHTTIHNRKTDTIAHFRPPVVNPSAMNFGAVAWYPDDQWLMVFRSASPPESRIYSKAMILARDGSVKRDLNAYTRDFNTNDLINWLPARVRIEILPPRTTIWIEFKPDAIIEDTQTIKNVFWGPTSDHVVTTNVEHYPEENSSALWVKLGTPDSKSFRKLFWLNIGETFVWDESGDGALAKTKGALPVTTPIGNPTYSINYINSAQPPFTIPVNDARSGVEVCRIPTRDYYQVPVSFSPDGKLALIASVYNALEIWHVPTCTQRAVLDMSEVFAFSPDGAWLAVGHSWNVDLYRMSRFR